MSVLARIAVIGHTPSTLAVRLSALPERPLVRAFQDLVQEIDHIVAFGPKVIVFEHEQPSAEDMGALRLCAALLPGLDLVIASPRAREAEVRPLAQQIGATFLALPADEDELLAALATLRSGGRAQLAPLLDLVRGLADEINNPLQQALGHLQLLRAQLARGTEPDLVTQAEAIDEGLRRITTTLGRLEILARAGAPRGPARLVALAAALEDALAEIQRERGIRPAATAPAANVFVHAEPEVPRMMIGELLRGAIELAPGVAQVEVAGGRDDRGVWVRARIDRPLVEDWRLPELYAPYFLSRAIKGSRHGLALFVAQTIAYALGGQATARRVSDRRLELELLLPPADG